jgi:hypothetical protein
MNNGKQTKEYGWREDFLAWEKNLSAIGEGNPVLWDRMVTRLQMPVKRKRYYFAWAAAVLFFISGLVFLLNYPFITEEVYTRTFKYHPHLINNQFLEKSAIPGTAIVKKPAIKNMVTKTTGSLPKENSTRNHSIESPVVNVPKVIADSPLIAISIPAAQPKKIRVVHMNEWFSPPPPVYAKSKEDEAPYKPSLWPGKNRGLAPPSSNN